MPNYVRNFIQGGTFFFTLVTHERRPWLCSDSARQALRHAIETVRMKLPFSIEAWVLLPDHLHCIWTLPPGDGDFSTRWRLIKTHVSKMLADETTEGRMTASRLARRERGLWQRRFWEHTIRDEADLTAHCNYLHYNPVKHGHCDTPSEWAFSSFHRYVEAGVYPGDWGSGVMPSLGEGIGGE